MLRCLFYFYATYHFSRSFLMFFRCRYLALQIGGSQKSVDLMLRYRHKPKAKTRPKSIAHSAVQQKREKVSADVGSLMVAAPFISALIAVYFGFVSINALLESQPVAHVGDILEIPIQAEAASDIPPIPARLLATAWASPGRARSLDIGTIKRIGGSATVLALRPDGVMLEWAGPATTTGNGDCDTNHAILIRDGDYKELSGLQLNQLPGCRCLNGHGKVSETRVIA
jgi:hypothetical protein